MIKFLFHFRLGINWHNEIHLMTSTSLIKFIHLPRAAFHQSVPIIANLHFDQYLTPPELTLKLI